MSKRSDYYMNLARLSSTRSKDPYTKVGACLVKDGRVLSIGYNGAPRSFPDDAVPLGRDSSLPLKDQKNSYMCHAELNAILNYGGSLRDLDGSTLYVTVSPCCDCAKALAQVGVKDVIYGEEYKRPGVWDVSKIIFDKCGITYNKEERDDTSN